MDDAITAAVSSLHDDAGLVSAMRNIGIRHMAGRDTPDDRAAYLTFWIASTLHQSAGRRPYVPVEVDGILAERAWLEREVADMGTVLAVEAVFSSTPEDETPTTVGR